MGKVEIGHQKLSAQYIRREIQEADEANLLDEEGFYLDINISFLFLKTTLQVRAMFGRARASQLYFMFHHNCVALYAYFWFEADDRSFEFDICKLLSSREDISPELDGPAVIKKPPRKERKKSTQTTEKATPVRELKKLESVDSYGIAASESHVAEKIQMNPSAEPKRNVHLNSNPKMNGSRVDHYALPCSEDATKASSKPLKRTATENPSNPVTKNLCMTAAEVPPYVPAPLATKIYYSQRNQHLRRAISHMFFDEPSKEVLDFEVLQVNADPTQTPAPSNFYHEQFANPQAQRDESYTHVAQTPDQILAARSECHMGKSGGLVPSMNTASQLPMNNALGSHYASNSYSFAGKSGNSIGTLQQGNGSVPVFVGPGGEFCFGKGVVLFDSN
ncbi:hypothetical protein PHJA_000333100 [Phtheirospermum japonicum]|uniref:Uncharacterized protein n=1 Tax=Phtheirospermum japonicum TaxID=374723 RepID=A0A830BA04_9LAMI|nr:hypothetical protein PHJA_000333100 [Phtheirospermum japonicum]